MYFPSKRDIWMTVILWICIFLLIIPPIFLPDLGVWMTPKFLDKQWIKIVLLGSFGTVIAWIWFKTGYIIEDNWLKIQYGPFKKKIKIAEIETLRRTKNPFTSPALSMDKIEINYGKFYTVSISPKNKQEFMRQLLEINPYIKIIKEKS